MIRVLVDLAPIITPNVPQQFRGVPEIPQAVCRVADQSANIYVRPMPLLNQSASKCECLARLIIRGFHSCLEVRLHIVTLPL
ncbi:hypothetical protein D3C76_1633400 [compost metagenome]